MKSLTPPFSHHSGNPGSDYEAFSAMRGRVLGISTSGFSLFGAINCEFFISHQHDSAQMSPVAQRVDSRSASVGSDARKVLIVDDVEEARWVLSTLMQQAGHTPLVAVDGKQAIAIIESDAPDLVLLDVGLPDMDGFDVLTWARAHDKGIPVIMITGSVSVGDATRAMRSGAYDYVSKPFSNEDMLLTVRHALEEKGLRRQPRQLHERRRSTSSLEALMGSSAAIQRVVQHVAQVAPTDFSVLITGETGCGKELIAQAIHVESLRSSHPLVVLDCGSIPETLIESELFGHEKGSFTGAHQAMAGAFELAHGGAIFLDEIGSLPLAMQGKLLRALETRRIHRVGGAKERAFDFRVIAATNVDLNAAVAAGLFRRDLYHRLAEFSINVPPLRERKEDLGYLVHRTLNAANGELGRRITNLSDAAWKILTRYDWPGNVRELRNQLRRAVLLSDESDLILEATAFVMLDVEDSLVIPDNATRTNPRRAPEFGEVSNVLASALEKVSSGQAVLSLRDLVRDMATQFEKMVLLESLKMNAGNKAKVARSLSIDYKTLHTKLRACGITSDAPTHSCTQISDATSTTRVNSAGVGERA